MQRQVGIGCCSVGWKVLFRGKKGAVLRNYTKSSSLLHSRKMTKLSEYLADLQNQSIAQSIVIGNKACDLDSIASSIVYAYFLNCTVEPTIPVLCIPKNDLALRTEVTYLLNMLNISTDALIFLDSLLIEKLRNRNIKINLVDHNQYDNSMLKLQSYGIETIVDHHVDEHSSCKGVKRIEMVGSCCTLITSIIQSNPELFTCDDIVKLLAGTILIDTINLDFDKGRTTPLDVEMFNFLCIDGRDELYNALISSKTDISSLSVHDLLRRDSKNFEISGGHMVYISSITGANWEEFSKREDAVSGTEKYISQNRLSVLIIMLASHGSDGSFKRYLLITHGMKLVRDISGCISDLSKRLNLVEVKAVPVPFTDWLVYEQLDVKSSRKVVLPLVKSWLQGIELSQPPSL